MTLPNDPILSGGLEQFAKDLRNGTTSSFEVTKKYLERIEMLDDKLGAYQFVNHLNALKTAQAIDALLSSGVDLGPLMGVPIAIKDVFNISDFPKPTAGSHLDISKSLSEVEGAFITALKKLGVIILGTTKSVEFCLGITGVSESLGTPWNPWDLENHRVPGGSSSGSAVACAAGLCAFAIGTDSGGSIRVPASFNGLFGLKTSFGRWPTEGCFPLDRDVDTIGLLTKSAIDCQIIFSSIEQQLFGYKYDILKRDYEVSGLVFGKPSSYFSDDLTKNVSAAFDLANNKLLANGANLKDITISEASERDGYFPVTMPASLIASLGQDQFTESKSLIDPTIAARVATGLDIKAHEYIHAQIKRENSILNAQQYFDSVDVIATPTTVTEAPCYADFADLEFAMYYAFLISRNTQPANYLSMCAASLPLPVEDEQMPVGYQLMAAFNDDAKLLRIAVAIEKIFGIPKLPEF